MKILIVGTSVIPIGTGRYGGIEKLCLDYIEEFVNLGHNLTVAAPIGSKLPNGANLIETVLLPNQQDNDLLAYNIVSHTVKLEEFDVIHDFSHGHQFARNRPELPTISMMWDPIIYKYDKAPHNILCASKWQGERFKKVYWQDYRIGVLCVDPQKYSFKSEKVDDYLFIGKITEEKGVHIAAEICKREGLSLDIIGGLIPSDQRTYLERVNSLCDAKIRLHFNTTEEEKIAILQSAKAVLYPVQQEEAHWLGGVEAWACGTPTLALNRGAMSEIGCLVYDDITGMEAALKAEQYGEPAQWYEHSKDYHRSVVVSRLLGLYQKVVGGAKW